MNIASAHPLSINSEVVVAAAKHIPRKVIAFLPASDIWRRRTVQQTLCSWTKRAKAMRGASHEKASLLPPSRSFNPVRRRDRERHPPPPHPLLLLLPLTRVSYHVGSYPPPAAASRINGCIDRSHLITNSGTKMRWWRRRDRMRGEREEGGSVTSRKVLLFCRRWCSLPLPTVCLLIARSAR